VPPELVDDRLDAKHEELEPQVETELQAFAAGPVVQDGVDQRHYGSFKVHVIAICACRPIQVIYNALEKKIIAKWIRSNLDFGPKSGCGP
jgi:hypothetical protein